MFSILLSGCSPAETGGGSNETGSSSQEGNKVVTYKMQACHEESDIATLSVNGEKVTDAKASYTAEDFADEFILKKGKKSFCKLTM